MAINLGQGRGKKRRVVCDINVTPMVDVMLVLLIIFMITSPMLVGGVEVNLPKTNANASSGQFKPLIVSIDKKGEFYLFESKLKRAEIIPKIKEVTKQNKDAKIFIKGDRSVSYGLVAEIMALLQEAGFNKVMLVSDI